MEFTVTDSYNSRLALKQAAKYTTEYQSMWWCVWDEWLYIFVAVPS